jgi:hypothetical protein
MNMMRNFTPRPQSPNAPRPADPRAARPADPRSAGAARPAEARPGMAPQRGKAEDIFMVLRQLSELLVKENLALKRYRVEEVKALAERKDRLAVLYQSHMTAIHRDPTILAGLDTAKRAQLAQLATRLAELMRDNASMLKANIQTIDTFFQAVNDAVREREEKKSASYSRAGMLNTYATPRRSLAVSYNKTT